MLRPIAPQARSGRHPTEAPASCATMYPMPSPDSSFPISRKPSVTAGFMFAPLTFPTGEREMSEPNEPKRKPVTARRTVSLGSRRAIGVPVPNIRITSERPLSTSSPVPINSETSISNLDRVSVERLTSRRPPARWLCLELPAAHRLLHLPGGGHLPLLEDLLRAGRGEQVHDPG